MSAKQIIHEVSDTVDNARTALVTIITTERCDLRQAVWLTQSGERLASLGYALQRQLLKKPEPETAHDKPD